MLNDVYLCVFDVMDQQVILQIVKFLVKLFAQTRTFHGYSALSRV